MPAVPSLLASLDRNAVTAVPAALPADELLLAAQPRVRRLVHRLLGWPTQAAEVDDVVQEVLLAAWQHRGTFRGDAAWTTWLSTIAIRKARQHARRRRGWRRLLPWSTTAEQDLVAPSADTAGDERLAGTQAAMRRLPHPDRELLVLRYLENREVPALADLLGISRAAVDQRLTRARARLRALLDREER